MDHSYKFFEGLCNLELGNYDKAEENLKEDIFIQSNVQKNQAPHYNSLLYMGILYYEMGKNDLAKQYLLQCLGIYKELPEANYYLAMTYKKEHNNLLRKEYLQLARRSILNGFGMNEDNIFYSNYPHQITLYEIDNELAL